MRLSRSALIWAAQPALAGLALCVSLARPDRALTVPVNDSPGALQTLVQAKTTLDFGWWWTNPSLGAPSGFQAVLVAREAGVDHLVLGVVGFIARDVASAVNISWMLMLILGAAAAAWCLRRLGVSTAGAWVMGVLYGLCPYALYWNIEAPGVTPYLVPFAATAALALATDSWSAWPRRDRLALMAGTVLLGLNGLDYAYFGAILTAIGAVAGAVRARQATRVLTGGVVPAVIVAAVVLSFLPVALAWHQEGEPPGVLRPVADSESAGLKIRHLIGPLPDHWLPLFQVWTSRESHAGFPGETENQFSRLGLVAAAGFLGLLASLLIPAWAGPQPNGDVVRAASRLTLAGILLATVGGLGSAVSLLIWPRVTAYAHITPFLAFFALVAAAFWLDRVTVRLRRPHVLWAAVLILGLFDQSVAARPLNSRLAVRRAEHQQLRAFVSGLEQQLPPGAMVFQMPLRPYPLDRRQFLMGPYDHFRPYLVSHQLKWSYPALTAAQVRHDADRVEGDPADLPARLAREGFSAILVDRYGYRDNGDTIVEALLAAPGRPAVIDQTRRYVAIDLRPR
jgi:phosphoglycerol transferase